MTERNHDEIARRLRESGTVHAPHGLRDEVMSQVRAEPRVRPSRRPFFAPVLPYAAAAALVVGLVIAFAHLGGGGSGSSSAGAGASGGVSLAPEAGGTSAHDAVRGASRQAMFSLKPVDAQKFAALPNITATKAPGVIVLRVPRSLYADYKARLAKIERRTPEGPTIHVILRKIP
jgi:hypothetical protein